MESTPGAVTVLRPRWHFWATISLGLVCALTAIVLIEVWFSAELTDGLVSTLLSAPLTTVSLANLMGAGLFFLGSAIHGRLRPERLVLSDQGLLIDTRKRRRFVHWTEVKAFRVEMRRESTFAVLGWDHHDDASEGAPRWEGGYVEGNMKRGTTHDAQMEPGWALQPAALCELLESWRRRHAGRA